MSENFREVYGWARTMDEGKAKAKNAAKRIGYSKRVLEVTMPGNTAIVAGMHVTMQGFRDGINGRFKVKTVRHTLSRAGFTTTITGEAA